MTRPRPPRATPRASAPALGLRGLLTLAVLTTSALWSAPLRADDTQAPPKLTREQVTTVHKLMAQTALRGSAVGAIQQIEHEAVALLKQVTRALNDNLPDCERALAAMTSLRETAAPAARAISKPLKEHRAQLRRQKPPALKPYQERMASRFADELATYERAVARFELMANNEQLLRFNALMKGIASPLMD
jgi:hypothetical protein